MTVTTTPGAVRRALRRWDDVVDAVEDRLARLEARLTPRVEGMTMSWRVIAAELVLGGFVLAALADDSTAGRALAAVGAIAGLGIVVMRDRREALVWLVVWLVALGTTRRVLSLAQVDPERDPLLAVAPVITLALALRAAAGGALRRLTPLNGLMVAYVVMVAIATLNPRQPSLGSAATGLVLWGMPIVFFWIGRGIGDDEEAVQLARVVMALGVVAAVYGILQLTVGIPPWDGEWLDVRDRFGDRAYAALYIGPDTVRPWGMSTSASGYAVFMGLVIVASVAAVLVAWRRSDGSRTVAWLGVLAVAAVAMVLSSVRSVLLLTLVAVFVVFVAATGRSIVKGLLVLVGIGLVSSLALSQVDPLSMDRDGVEGIFRRIVITVGHPFDSENHENTTSAHIRLFRDGVEDAFTNPLGEGPGSIGLAAERFGDDGRSTETDLSNAAVAFGLAGLLIVGAAKAVSIATAWRVSTRPPPGWSSGSRIIAFAVLGFTLVSLRDSFNGQHWAMASLVWLGVGYIDRRAWAPTGTGIADGALQEPASRRFRMPPGTGSAAGPRGAGT